MNKILLIIIHFYYFRLIDCFDLIKKLFSLVGSLPSGPRAYEKPFSLDLFEWRSNMMIILFDYYNIYFLCFIIY